MVISKFSKETRIQAGLIVRRNGRGLKGARIAIEQMGLENATPPQVVSWSKSDACIKADMETDPAENSKMTTKAGIKDHTLEITVLKEVCAKLAATKESARNNSNFPQDLLVSIERAFGDVFRVLSSRLADQELASYIKNNKDSLNYFIKPGSDGRD